MRLTILFLGAMLGILVVRGGVALADDAVGGQCGDWQTCRCLGGLCKGTTGDDWMYGTEEDFGDKIFAGAGEDNIYAYGGGDYVDGGPENTRLPDRDYIDGGDGNDTLYGGDDTDEIRGGPGWDQCYGGPDGPDGPDTFDGCEKRVQDAG